MKILIVDDDELDRALIKRALRDEPSITQICESISGYDAIQMLTAQCYDVVLLDYRLPDMNGLEFIEKLPAAYRFDSCFIMVSGDDDISLATTCLEAGIEDFLLKSEITSRRLMLSITMACQRHLMREEIRQAHKQLRQLAEQDSLTGVSNRYFFEENLRLALARAERNGGRLSLLMLDLDNFKAVNDTMGHDAGDQLLRSVTSRLESVLRKGDLLARLGGDEFVVLSSNAKHEDQAHHIAIRLLQVFGEPFLLDGKDVPVTCSIGVANYPACATDANGLLRTADMAMYRAKSEGRNQFCFHSEELHAEIMRKTRLEWDLGHAVAGHELELYYQPQHRVSDLAVVGVEALIRWRHPEFGVLSPDAFLSIAEESGMIVPIGEWVMKAACRQAKQWQDRFSLSGKNFKMAVNLSDTQIRERGLAQLIEKSLRESRLTAESLELELTETALVRNPEETASVLQSLQKLGIAISLDDFGTGYSSFVHLLKFPISRLKVDRECLSYIESDQRKRCFVDALIEMGRKMGMSVVVEGVETRSHTHLCSQWQADVMQGYFFSRPLPSEAVEELLMRHFQPANANNILKLDARGRDARRV